MKHNVAITQDAEVLGATVIPCGDHRVPGKAEHPTDLLVGPRPPVSFGPRALWVNSSELIDLCLEGEWGSDVERGWGMISRAPTAVYHRVDGQWVPWFYGDGDISPDISGHFGPTLANSWTDIWREISRCVFQVAKAIWNNESEVRCPWSLGDKIVARM